MKKFQGGASPSGGWSYTQPESGMPFHDFSIKAMQRKVFDHRMAVPKLLMDVSPGWQERFEHDLCEANSQAKWVERKEGDRKPSLLIRAKSFLSALYNLKLSGATMVDATEQQRRANICRSCPMKADITSICTACTSITRWAAQTVGGRHLVDIDGACSACGCVLSAKIAFPVSVLKKADGREVAYNPICWMLEDNGNS